MEPELKEMPHSACMHCRGTGRVQHNVERVRRRFLDKIGYDLESECWVWTGYLNEHGYGVMKTGSQVTGTTRPRLAHRIAYELFVGPIPDGLVLDHLCRNRYCVNPRHLEPVTAAENAKRGDAGKHLWLKNLEKTCCPHGHPYSGANLYITPSGARGCRKCRAEATKRKNARYKAERHARPFRKHCPWPSEQKS